jgi:Flp pilus assembly pilin Flp
MKLFKMKKYTKDESGAVTVDWVVLTAALVIIGGIVIGIIRAGLIDASNAINEELSEQATTLRTAT